MPESPPQTPDLPPGSGGASARQVPVRQGGWAAIAFAAAVVFGGLSWFMLQQEREALRASAVDDAMTPAGTLRPEALVSRAVRASRLVTIVFDTTVTAQSVSASWRGDAVATVRAPVRLMFGTDLSALDEGAVRLDPFGRAMVVSVPRPTRIATEVLGEGERSEVSVGWLRLRSIAGEYQLGLARKGLYEAARTMTLRREDAQLVEEATRDQVVALVKAVAGERTAVEVRFVELPASRAEATP